jgi:hypothetical protein
MVRGSGCGVKDHHGAEGCKDANHFDTHLPGYAGAMRWPMPCGYATVGTVEELGPGVPRDLLARFPLASLRGSADGLRTARARYGGAFLNDLPEFWPLNPSLERFAKALWHMLPDGLPRGTSCAVRLWENENSWAAYEPGPAAAATSA